ncbi:hypothetical protein ACFQGT_00505 [Natrialbaceae archaeon GCM10025810]
MDSVADKLDELTRQPVRLLVLSFVLITIGIQTNRLLEGDPAEWTYPGITAGSVGVLALLGSLIAFDYRGRGRACWGLFSVFVGIAGASIVFESTAFGPFLDAALRAIAPVLILLTMAYVAESIGRMHLEPEN